MEMVEDSPLTKENGLRDMGSGLGQGLKRQPTPDLPERLGRGQIPFSCCTWVSTSSLAMIH